ncbi:hypothetical protein [Sphingomonas sp. CLY1604]|uniref:hypothetical protein n=1 Tax=Sphingomonas sp. CLY1604 TaxID=3457786 RepID=UPI003FD7937B
MDTETTAALIAVARVMRHAEDDWWIIGSAAVALHGAATPVADIDLLTSERDARRLIATHRLSIMQPDDHPLFRSQLFARWPRQDRTVEIMAGLEVRDGAGWTPVEPRTQMCRTIAGEAIYLPDRMEMMAILDRFGRPKDQVRRALLAAMCTGAPG